MEVYVLLGLVSLGYMFTKRSGGDGGGGGGGGPASTGAHAVRSRNTELPAHRRYGPRETVTDVRTQEMLRAQDAERAAKYPLQTGAVDPRARAYTRNPLDSGVPEGGGGGGGAGTVRSELAGVDFAAADFRHNNMQPFFGSHVPQPMSGDTGSLLERFTGAPGPGSGQPKREIPAMFRPEESVDASNVHGNQSFSDAMQARFDDMNTVNRVHNNELPFEQVRVGPGVGQGFTSGGTGGFGQNQDREYAMSRYKDVDELRPGNKPKANLEGRLNAGAARGGQRGLMGQAAKNKPYTAFDIEEFGLVATRGAAADAQAVRPDPLHGKRLRNPPSTFRVEAAGSTRAEAPPVAITPEQANKVGAPKFRQETPELTGAGRAGAGNAGSEDMHRAFNDLGDNERTLSQALWSADGGSGAGAGAGGCAGAGAVMRAGPPGAVHVPGRDVRAHVDDGLRLSGREHTSDAADSHMFGMMSPQAPSRGPAYDPVRHRPNTTLKETAIHDARPGNYRNEQGQVGDEGAATRRTVREGFCDTYGTYGVRNPSPYMVQEGVGAPDADPRDHDLRTTGKEITSQGVHVGGVAPSGAAAVAPGGYDVTAAGIEEPKLTNRQFTEQVQYYGAGGRPDQTGYGVIDDSMRRTMTTSGGRTDFEYFGIPRHKNDKGVDYEAVYATTLNEAKQSLMRGRAPGGHGAGPKRMPNEHTQGEVFARVEDPYVTDYLPAPGNMPKDRGTLGSVAFQNNTGLHHDDRIDDQLLSYLKTNPLVVNPAVQHHAARVA